MNEIDFVEEALDFSKTLELDLAKKIHAFDDISSTNMKAKELAKKGAEQGTIVLSKIQTKGRGRFDRNWKSPEDGLYFSIILRPNCKPEKATIFPLLAALSICETVKSICDLDVKIKWPNDVLINGRKVSGILLETESKKDLIDHVIIGIGINLNIDLDMLSKEFNATSISYEIGIKLNYFDFFKKVLFQLDKFYKIFSEGKYDIVLSEWKQNSDTIGKNVKIKSSNEEMLGKAINIDENGFLIIKTESGENKKITSGDCFYII